MNLTKTKKVDKIETFAVSDHYLLNIREKTSIIEKDDKNNDIEIGASFHRYGLAPDSDISTIKDATVKGVFEVVMTDKVKANFQKFLKEQNAINNAK